MNCLLRKNTGWKIKQSANLKSVWKYEKEGGGASLSQLGCGELHSYLRNDAQIYFASVHSTKIEMFPIPFGLFIANAHTFNIMIFFWIFSNLYIKTLTKSKKLISGKYILKLCKSVFKTRKETEFMNQTNISIKY